MSELPSAGWYDDPDNPGVIARFWDGAAWTEARRPVPQPVVVREGTSGFAVGVVVLIALVVVIVLANHFA